MWSRKKPPIKLIILTFVDPRQFGHRSRGFTVKSAKCCVLKPSNSLVKYLATEIKKQFLCHAEMTRFSFKSLKRGKNAAWERLLLAVLSSC